MKKAPPKGRLNSTHQPNSLVGAVGAVCAICIIIVARDSCNGNNNCCNTRDSGRAHAFKANTTSGAWINTTTGKDTVDLCRCFASVCNAICADNCRWILGNAGATTNSGLSCYLCGSRACSHQKRSGECCKACHYVFSSLRSSLILGLVSHISVAIANSISLKTLVRSGVKQALGPFQSRNNYSAYRALNFSVK